MMAFMSSYFALKRLGIARVRASAAEVGQGGLIAIAVVLLITLTVGGGLLGSMSQQNAHQAILTAQNAQAYYAAQAGVQEAIATRMLPRSNYLNFDSNIDSSDGIPYFLKAYYATSGRISLDLSNDNRVIAKYRYMVLGGDSARESKNSYFPETEPNKDDPYLLSVNKIFNPFIVVSEGVICHADAQFGKALVNKFEGAGASKLLDAACQAGSRRDQVIVVAQVKLQNPDGVTADKIVGQHLYKNPQKIKLPAGTFVPGYGWMDANSEINFDTMWRANHQANNTGDKNPLTLKKIVVYNFTENQVIKNCDVNGPTNTSCGPIITNIPRQALAFRLYFNGPFDFRSISPRTNLRDNSLQDCKGSNANNCHIRVMPTTGPPPRTAYPSNIILPLYPGGTQVIVLPPLKAYGKNEKFSLEIDTTKMRSFNGERGKVNYSIDFQADNK
jgi:type II secretory pathway pseudopilin PulG